MGREECAGSQLPLVLPWACAVRARRRRSAGPKQLSEPGDPHRRALSRRRHRRHRRPCRDQQVGRDWKQTVVVEARPGGNSNIGTAAVARSEPEATPGWSRDRRRWSTPPLKDAGWDAMKDLKCVGLAVWKSERSAGASVDAGQNPRRIRGAGAEQAGLAQFRQPRHRLVVHLTRKNCFRSQTSSSPISATRVSRRR